MSRLEVVVAPWLTPMIKGETIEQRALLPWDGLPYDVSVWGTVKVAQDYHSLERPLRAAMRIAPGQGGGGERPLGLIENEQSHSLLIAAGCR